MATQFSLDHHIQSAIVLQLLTDGEQSFSSLKPDGVENSLFMYHMRKLIGRGIVSKTTTGFTLTPEGARWANKSGAELSIPELPRPMVQLLVIKDGRVLIAERADHLARHMNRYMLPGTLHHFGETSHQAAERVAARLNLSLISDRIDQFEVILPESSHHSIVDLYLATTSSVDYLLEDGIFRLQFTPLQTVLGLSKKHANTLPDVIRRNLPE